MRRIHPVIRNDSLGGGDNRTDQQQQQHAYDYQPSSSPLRTSAHTATPERTYYGGATTTTTRRLTGGGSGDDRGRTVDSSAAAAAARPVHTTTVRRRSGHHGEQPAPTAWASSLGSQPLPRGSRDSSVSSVRRRRKVELVRDQYSMDDDDDVSENDNQFNTHNYYDDPVVSTGSSSHANATTEPLHETDTSSQITWVGTTAHTPPRGVSDRVAHILAPLLIREGNPSTSNTAVVVEAAVALSPFSPWMKHRKRRRNEPLNPHHHESVPMDGKNTAMEDLSLAPCRKVSVVVTVGESRVAGSGGIVSDDHHPTPRHSNESNQVCIFSPTEDTVTTQSRHETSAACCDDTAHSMTLDARTMIVVNPTAFGTQVPVSVTMDTARLVTQQANLSSDDWARTYRFQQILWSQSVASRNHKMEALYNLCQAVVNDLLAPGSIAHRILLGTATGLNATTQQTSQLFGTVGQQSIAHVFSESNADMSVEYILDRFGLVGLTVHGVLKRIGASNTSNVSRVCTLSVLEVSGEDTLFDLLASKPFSVKGGTQVKFKYEDNGAVTTGLSESSVDSLKSVGHLMRRAFAAALHKNRRAGRGHIIVTVHIFHKLNPTKRTSCQFIDLVAIERGEDGTTARRNSVKRKSLSALGAVLRGTLLKEAGNDTPISYRDSLLTKVMQRSMVQSDTRVVLLSTVSPDTDQYTDTMATLRYLDQLMHRSGQMGNNAFGTLDRHNQSSVLSPTSPGAKDVLNLSIDQFADEERGILLRELVSDPRQRLARVMLPPQSPGIGTQQIEKYTPTKYTNPYNNSNQNQKDVLRDQGSILSTSPRESEVLAEMAELGMLVDSTLRTLTATQHVDGNDSSLLLPPEQKHVLLENDDDLTPCDNADDLVTGDDPSDTNRYPTLTRQPFNLDDTAQNFSEVEGRLNYQMSSPSHLGQKGHTISDDEIVSFPHVGLSPEQEIESNRINSNPPIESSNRRATLVGSISQAFDASRDAVIRPPTGEHSPDEDQAVSDRETTRLLQDIEHLSTRVWAYDDISYLSQPSRSDEMGDVQSTKGAFAGDELEHILRERSIAGENNVCNGEHYVEVQSTDKSLESLLREPEFDTTTNEELRDKDLFDEILDGDDSLSLKRRIDVSASLSAGGVALPASDVEGLISMTKGVPSERNLPPPSRSNLNTGNDETADDIQLTRRGHDLEGFEERPSLSLSRLSGMESCNHPATSGTFVSASAVSANCMDDNNPLTTYDLPPDSPSSSPSHSSQTRGDQHRNFITHTANNVYAMTMSQSNQTIGSTARRAETWPVARRSQLGNEDNGLLSVLSAVRREDRAVGFESSQRNSTMMNHEEFAEGNTSQNQNWIDRQQNLPGETGILHHNAPDSRNKHAINAKPSLLSDQSLIIPQSSIQVTLCDEDDSLSAIVPNATSPETTTDIDGSSKAKSNKSRLSTHSTSQAESGILPRPNLPGINHGNDDLPTTLSNDDRLTMQSAILTETAVSSRSNLPVMTRDLDGLHDAKSNISRVPKQSNSQTETDILSRSNLPGILSFTTSNDCLPIQSAIRSEAAVFSRSNLPEIPNDVNGLSDTKSNNSRVPLQSNSQTETDVLSRVNLPGTNHGDDDLPFTTSNDDRLPMQSAIRTKTAVFSWHSLPEITNDVSGLSDTKSNNASGRFPLESASQNEADTFLRSHIQHATYDDDDLSETKSNNRLPEQFASQRNVAIPQGAYLLRGTPDDYNRVHLQPQGATNGLEAMSDNSDPPGKVANTNVPAIPPRSILFETGRTNSDTKEVPPAMQANATSRLNSDVSMTSYGGDKPSDTMTSNSHSRLVANQADVVALNQFSDPHKFFQHSRDVTEVDKDSPRRRDPLVDRSLSVVSEFRGHRTENTVLDEIDQLQADVDKVKQTNLSVWQSSLASFDNLRNFLSAQKAAMGQLVFERDKALREVKRLEHELKQQEESQRQIAIQFEGQIKAFHAELKKMHLDKIEVVKIAEEAIATQAELEQRVTELEAELSLLTENSILRTDHESLVYQHRTLEQEVDNLKQEATWYHEELSGRNAMIAELQAISKKFESDMRKHRDDLLKHEAETESLKKALDEAHGAEIEAANLRKENINLALEIQSVQSSRQKRENELLLEQNAKVDSAEKCRRDAEIAYSELLAVQEKLQSESLGQRSEIQDLRDELSRLQKENTMYPFKLHDAERQQDELQKSKSELQRELDHTRASLESRISDVQELMSNLTRLVADKEKDQHKILKMEKALSSFQDETRSRVEKVVHHRNEAALLLEKTVEENKALTESNQTLQSALEEVHTQLNNTNTKTNESTAGHLGSVMTENRKLRDEVERLHQQVGQLEDHGVYPSYRLSQLDDRYHGDSSRRAMALPVRDTERRGQSTRLRGELDAFDRRDHRGDYHQAGSNLLDLQRVEEVAANVAFAAKTRLEMGSIETNQIKEKLFALEDAKDEEINSLKSRIKSLERQTMARNRGL